MSFTINGRPCLVVVDSSRSLSYLSRQSWISLGSFDLDEPVHVISRLPSLSKFSLSLKVLVGDVPASATASQPSVSLGSDWLAMAVRTAFNGIIGVALSVLAPFSEASVLPLIIQTPAFVSSSPYPVSTPPSQPYGSFPSASFFSTPAPHVQPYHLSGWGSSDSRAPRYDGSVLKPPSIPLYLTPSYDPLYLFSLYPQQLYATMAMHNIPSVSLSAAQCQEAIIFHLASGACVENSKLGPSTPSGCYHTGHSYDHTLAMAFHVVSLFLQHYVEAPERVSSRISSALGFDDDIDFPSIPEPLATTDPS
ncbi:hypothetical protein PM082_017595 [Marasmius tenuissimus]|nr:hypothetical protein PM082_017595 [Marasmius tenuissimus]